MAVNPRAVAQIGTALGNHATESGKVLNPVEPMGAGRGFTSPKDEGKTVHHNGSQKRHS